MLALKEVNTKAWASFHIFSGIGLEVKLISGKSLLKKRPIYGIFYKDKGSYKCHWTALQGRLAGVGGIEGINQKNQL